MSERAISGQAPVPPPAAARARPGSAGAPVGGSPSALRRAVLLHLRQHGPSAPDGIAAAIGASRSGVAQQLRALESAGLVTRTSVRHGVGRPHHLYDVTPDAQELFPANYDGLATGLLAAVLEVGGDALVEEVFAARRRQAEARIRERIDATVGDDAPLIDRVAAVAGLQDELGYLAEARADADAIRLVEHNCAVLDVARSNPA